MILFQYVISKIVLLGYLHSYFSGTKSLKEAYIFYTYSTSQFGPDTLGAP